MIDRCAQFEQRMHERLDQRRPLSADAVLTSHADHCARCQQTLDAWRSIDLALPSPRPAANSASVLRPQSLSTSQTSSLSLAWIALAAMVLATMTGLAFYSNQPVAPTAQAYVPAVPNELLEHADPVAWWNEARDRDWISQTMPTVRSVREGVAPLGRSLIRAVTILTTGTGDGQTS
ncbi:hypothetical protein [Rubripirellula reticaptiva]|uniref:Zinc-finger domain-containing protein n=1 Tax=Rubripirellula reticaptiva TaxID=2528013 RepID=A0A5C6F885_9BACT|nr:hypothetical protein [Rubripirellula reticaptiva]TWU57485.1 hypothetical protein Poly59_03920 [Rubripirellula reticaptiva]